MILKKQKGLKVKIREYMDSVTVDVFGYEKKVSENVTRYLGAISNEHKIPLGHINIRITKPTKELEANIYDQDTHVRKVTLDELVRFFMGEGINKAFDLKTKIKVDVENYLKAFSQEKKVVLQALNVRISKPKDQVLVVAYKSAEYAVNIQLKELIKHFNK